MADEVTLLGELPPTQLAFVGLLPGVDAHVLRQTVLASEAHAALLARKRLEPQVAAHVACHGASLGEHFAADVAGEGPGQPVALFVLPQRRRVFVALSADGAPEGARFSATKVGGTHWSREVLCLILIFLLHKGRPAFFFDEELILRVSFYVSVELLGAGEALATGDAHIKVVSECWLKPFLAVYVVGAVLSLAASSRTSSSSPSLPFALPAVIRVVLPILSSFVFFFALEGLVRGKTAAAPRSNTTIR